MALCNADTLLSQACDSKFLQLVSTDAKLAQAVLLQLLCNLSASSGTTFNNLSGNGSPVGVVTPDYAGQIYTDLSTPSLWTSTGLTNASWLQVV